MRLAPLLVASCGFIGYESRPPDPSATVSSETETEIATVTEAPAPTPLAEEPCASFPFGDGREGSFIVAAGETRIVNEYFPVTDHLSAGGVVVGLQTDVELRLGSTLLFWQTRLPNTELRGIDDDEPLPPVGYFETQRVADVLEGGLVQLCSPLLNSYALGAQVLRVPQFESLDVQEEGTLTAPAWNGGAGGGVAVMVAGDLKLDGTFTTTALGLRGGSFNSESEPTCEGGHTGEGLTGDFSPNAQGPQNSATGGGGGSCHNNGGGGGRGAGGAGGSGGVWGGWESSGPDLARQRAEGGRGNLAVQGLSLGSGGGSGSGENNGGSSGEAGGGAIWLRAASIGGFGQVVADGVDALDSTADGAGGGGGGGSIVIETGAFHLGCQQLSAAGGAGGDSLANHGRGGGGGGGYVSVRPDQSLPLSCPEAVTAGAGRGTGFFASDPGSPGLSPGI